MKNLKYLQLALIVTLLVTAVSCTVSRGSYYEEDPYNNSRYYGNTPYYGNGSNYIILERDPFTGQYYEALPRGGSYPYRSNNYGTYNNTYRNYDRRNDRQSSTTTTRNDNNYNEQRQKQEEQRQEEVNKMREAKGSVLGKKKD